MSVPTAIRPKMVRFVTRWWRDTTEGAFLVLHFFLVGPSKRGDACVCGDYSSNLNPHFPPSQGVFTSMSTLWIYCKFCPGFKFNSDSVYKMHVRGKNHKLALEKQRVAEEARRKQVNFGSQSQDSMVSTEPSSVSWARTSALESGVLTPDAQVSHL